MVSRADIPETDVLVPRCHTRVPSPLGDLMLVATPVGLCGLYFVDRIDARVPLGTADPAPFNVAVAQLEEYWAGRRHTFELVLDPFGTSFQRAVWTAIAGIPYGATVTYAEIAVAVGRPRAARAVGAATGHNPLSIVVPCHRVVGRDGRLTGYGGGLDRKRWLLAHEATPSKVPKVQEAVG
jgi:methylated-DNA-[protein]-cysteine S-methyltransferase